MLINLICSRFFLAYYKIFILPNFKQKNPYFAFQQFTFLFLIFECSKNFIFISKLCRFKLINDPPHFFIIRIIYYYNTFSIKSSNFFSIINSSSIFPLSLFELYKFANVFPEHIARISSQEILAGFIVNRGVSSFTLISLISDLIYLYCDKCVSSQELSLISFNFNLFRGCGIKIFEIKFLASSDTKSGKLNCAKIILFIKEDTFSSSKGKANYKKTSCNHII